MTMTVDQLNQSYSKDASIASLEKSIEIAKRQLQECEEKQQNYRQQIGIVTSKLFEIGSKSDLRRQQLTALKMQYDNLAEKYKSAMAYADMMSSSEDDSLKVKAVDGSHNTQKELQQAEHAYLQLRHDCDQAEASDLEVKKSLDSEHGSLISSIAETEQRKRAIRDGLEVATEKLGVLLYESAGQRLTRYQADLVSKENELHAACDALETAYSQELSKLAKYPQLQLKFKSLVPFQDEVSILLDQAISLLTNYLATCEVSIPTLQKMTGEKMLRRVLEGNQLTFNTICAQLIGHDVERLQASIAGLRSVLSNYIETGVR